MNDDKFINAEFVNRYDGKYIDNELAIRYNAVILAVASSLSDAIQHTNNFMNEQFARRLDPGEKVLTTLATQVLRSHITQTRHTDDPIFNFFVERPDLVEFRSRPSEILLEHEHTFAFDQLRRQAECPRDVTLVFHLDVEKTLQFFPLVEFYAQRQKNIRPV